MVSGASEPSFDDEHVVELGDKRAQGTLEIAKVNNHVLLLAARLQLVDLYPGYDAPPVPVKVLALPVVIA